MRVRVFITDEGSGVTTAHMSYLACKKSDDGVRIMIYSPFYKLLDEIEARLTKYIPTSSPSI